MTEGIYMENCRYIYRSSFMPTIVVIFVWNEHADAFGVQQFMHIYRRVSGFPFFSVVMCWYWRWCIDPFCTYMCILIPLLRCWFDCLISSWLPMFYGKHNFRDPCYANDLQSYLKFGNLEWDKLLVCRLWYMLPLFCL